MAFAGLLLAVLLTLLQILSEQGVANGPEMQSWSASGKLLALKVGGQLPGSTWIVALLWAAVVASGVFAGEFRPGLEQFWRSRPISPSAWFWVKYFAGLAAVLGVLDLVTIVVSWNSALAHGADQMSKSYLACMPFLHGLIYSLAVFWVCWLRRPVIAAMGAVLCFFLLTIALGSSPALARFDPVQVYNLLFFDEKNLQNGTFHLARHGYPIVYGATIAVTVLASLAAWRTALRPAGIGFWSRFDVTARG
jgi:hypothetical protein